MKAKYILVALCFLFAGHTADSQILKKLKKKVEKTTEKVLLKKTEQQTEKTVEGSIDGITGNDKNSNNVKKNSPTSYSKSKNEAKLINTHAKQTFYTSDVIVKTSDSKGKGSEYYFDSDEIAARGVAPNSDKPIFIDSEGFQYGFNEGENRWEKTGLMKSDAMSFMMPMMSIGILKLPAEPSLNASKKLKEQGLNMNTFQIVEWAFIYKPEHFRSEDYEETTAPCPDGGDCPKFIYTDPEYKGSWVLFDSQERLSEIYANVNTQQAQGDGSYKFTYQPVSVSLPDAVEVKMPFQDLFLAGADATPPGENIRDQGIDSGENVDNDSAGISHKSMGSMTINLENSDLGTEDLPPTYDFDWKYRLKMKMENQKQDPFDLVVLLRKNTNYQGISVENMNSGSLDGAMMVFDLTINALVMFIESGGSKFLQIHPMQKPKKADDIGELEIRKLPDKTIMGYTSKGMEIENDEFIVQVYHTTEAPIEMSNLFNFSGPMDMNMPDIDPRLLKQFSEGLVTEMHYIDKKKSRNNVVLTGQSLNQVKTSIHTNEYQNMSFMGQLKSNKN
ncbi:hypothetical protein [Christiangramia echinicola]|uniref:DUF4412 domain-containing protein n=1 Tax=Christiangramia echinicola TaxID=279359 RepID=A0A1H1RSK2_9FLAO|nr:hypothetical protein [Christiangramia echinicola]SDS38688.1 hypothetical protein SAMN04488552_3008 [Christiangramia echinicola]